MDRSTTKYRKCCDASTIDIVSKASVLDDSRISDDSSISVDTDSAPHDDGKKSTWNDKLMDIKGRRDRTQNHLFGLKSLLRWHSPVG